MIKFISDFHFNHERIINFERTQFSTIGEHDRFILSEWKKNVGEKDTVYFLGDLGFASNDLCEKFKKLPGKKIMIKGNHDTRSNEYYINMFGFDEVSSVPIYISKRIVCSHEPIKVNDDVINIHGHLHNATLALSNYINVSCYMTNFKFLSLKKINNLLCSLPKLNCKFLYEWYAPYYKFNKSYLAYNPNIVVDDNRIIQLKKSLENIEKENLAK